MKVKEQLSRWTGAGLLSAEQAAAAIERYEAEHPNGRLGWVLWGIGSIGALAVITGIISLIAANWRDIPDGMKLATWFAMIGGTVIGAWQFHERKQEWLRDVTLLIHVGLVPAGIGLIAQIYHLSGDPWRAWGLSAALALIPALIASRGIVTDAFLGYATLAYGYLLEKYDLLSLIREEERFFAGFLTCALMLLLLFLAPVVERFRHASAAAMRRWGVGLIGVVALENALQWDQNGPYRYGSFLAHSVCGEAGCLSWPVGLFVVVVWGWCAYELSVKRSGYASRVTTVISLAMMLLLELATRGALSIDARQLIGFALFSIMALAMTMVSANAGSRGATNFFSLVVAARVVVLFIELVEDLSKTGVVLMLTGAVLFGVAWGWWKLRQLIPVRPEKSGVVS